MPARGFDMVAAFVCGRDPHNHSAAPKYNTLARERIDIASACACVCRLKRVPHTTQDSQRVRGGAFGAAANYQSVAAPSIAKKRKKAAKGSGGRAILSTAAGMLDRFSAKQAARR